MFAHRVPQCGHSLSPQSVAEPKFSPSPTLPLPPAFPVSNPSPSSLVRTSPAVPVAPNCTLPSPTAAAAASFGAGASIYAPTCLTLTDREYPPSTCASAALHAHLQKQLLLQAQAQAQAPHTYHQSVTAPVGSLTIGHFPGPLEQPPPSTTAYACAFAEPVPEFETGAARVPRLTQHFFSNPYSQSAFFDCGEQRMDLQSPTSRPVAFGALGMPPDLKPDVSKLDAAIAASAFASQRGAFAPILQTSPPPAFSFGVTSAASGMSG